MDIKEILKEFGEGAILPQRDMDNMFMDLLKLQRLVDQDTEYNLFSHAREITDAMKRGHFNTARAQARLLVETLES